LTAGSDGAADADAATEQAAHAGIRGYLREREIRDVTVGTVTVTGVILAFHAIGLVAVYQFGYGTTPDGLINASGHGPVWAYTVVGARVTVLALIGLAIVVLAAYLLFLVVTATGAAIRSFGGDSDA
jgi:hypothetical protein